MYTHMYGGELLGLFRAILYSLYTILHKQGRCGGLGVKGFRGLEVLGSKDPNNGVLGPKYIEYSSMWALEPYCLDPWTLRVGYSPVG